jgi:hypothetical protein
MNGLPTSEVTDYPNVQVLRAQRVVFQYWKVAVPWAAAQTVTVANGGDVAKEAGVFPAEALRPMTLLEATAPEGSTPTSPPTAPTSQPASPAATPTQASAAPAGGGAMLQAGTPLKVDLVGTVDRPKPGQKTPVPLRVTDGSGRGVAGAVVLILVHYPLKSDDTTYATDGIFFSQTRTDQSGAITAEFTIDPKVPSGLGVQLEISAIYPPTSGRLSLPIVVG